MSTSRRAGLSPSDVSLVFLQPADALGAFKQRQVDAWADPYTAQAEADIPVRSIAEAAHPDHPHRSSTTGSTAATATRSTPC